MRQRLGLFNAHRVHRRLRLFGGGLPRALSAASIGVPNDYASLLRRTGYSLQRSARH